MPGPLHTVGAPVTAEALQAEGSFGARFVAEAERLGVPLSATQVERLSRGTKGQIMLAVEKRLPSLNPELLRLLSRRGPEELARELSRRSKTEGGAQATAAEVVDIAYAIDIFGALLSGLDAS